MVVVTGGGSGALEQLLCVPGASRTLAEARIPYASAALDEWLGGAPDRACDPETARAMAMVAYRRARALDADHAAFGIGCTASLITDRPKRGEHRVHVAVQTAAATQLTSLVFDAGTRTRAEEEAVCVALVLNAIAFGKGLGVVRDPLLHDSEQLVQARHDGPDHWQDLLHERTTATHHALAAAPPRASQRRPVFPGAFNPVHAGHLEMARIAAQIIGAPTEFELCVRNVDKPPLNYADIARRTHRFGADTTIWLTGAPTFAEKAELFPGAVFVVGADTITRIADPRYYGNDADARDAAMRAIAAANCSFLVFGRNVDGTFTGLDDLDLPQPVRDLAQGVDESTFRADIASSSLRRNSDPD